MRLSLVWLMRSTLVRWMIRLLAYVSQRGVKNGSAAEELNISATEAARRIREGKVGSDERFVKVCANFEMC